MPFRSRERLLLSWAIHVRKTRVPYRPHQVVAVGHPDKDGTTVPILRHRALVDGRATAYVCVRMVCQPPVTESEALLAQLQDT